MCYLCMLHNPYAVSTDSSSPRYKRQRLMEIKQMMRAIEGDKSCKFGRESLEVLKDEQYRLSRELL